jgi:superfamily II DNA or RNA helicase
MSQKSDQPSRLNRFARLLIGLRPPAVVDIPVMDLIVEVEGIEPRMPEASSLNVLRPLVTTIVTLRSNALNLEKPEMYRFRESIFPDIPGLLHSPTNLLFFKAASQRELEVRFTPSDQEELSWMVIDNWPEIRVEDLVHLLADENYLGLEVRELSQAESELWLELPEQETPDFFLPPSQVEDLTETDLHTWPPIVVEDAFSILKGTGQAGKTYDREQAAGAEEPPEPIKPQDLETCIHGLIKAACAICAEEKKRKRKRPRGKAKPRVINPFDLLLPFLYPPLGKNIDNVLVFPPGKDLYNFQRLGIRFLATHRTALLADEMGLGKSIQAIFALRLLFRSSNQPQDALILCPKSVLKDWEKKFQEWAPELRIAVITGNPTLREVLWSAATHVYLTTYDTLARDIAGLPSKRFTIVVLDEVQSIKSPTAKRTKAVRQIEAEWRWGLSGTPLENKVEELISIFAYLEPKLLTYYDASNPVLIKQKIKDYFLRRRMKDVRDDLKLGDKIYREVWLELTPDQRKAYDRIAREARQVLRPLATWYREAEIDVRGKTLAQLHRLKQICNLDPDTGQSCKADYLLEKLEEIREVNEKALVFSQYPNVSLKPLANRFNTFKPQFFDGSLSNTQRDKLIEQFQESDDAGIMLMSVKAGGVGITLTRANHVFFLDHWWNPAVARQAEGRAYRIGQDKTVFITSFCVADTIEERIRQILEHKEQLFKDIIDDQSEEIIKSITTEELLELFDLVVFDVRLMKPGHEIGKTIKVVSEVAKLDYSQARRLVTQFPSIILKGVSRDVASRARTRLESSGVAVEIESRPTD